MAKNSLIRNCLCNCALLCTLVLGFPLDSTGAVDYPEDLSETVVESADTWLITHARLVDGVNPVAIGDQDILISEGKIAAVGATGSIDVPPGIPTLDAAGKTVMPGLIMVHEHLFYNDHGAAVPYYAADTVSLSALYLSHGVTSIRTAGSMNITDDILIRKLIQSGRYPGPEVHLTAPYIDGPGSPIFQLRTYETDNEVREMVRYWANQGVGWLKGYMWVKPDILESAIDEAHKRNMKVTGHLCSVTYREAVEMGIDNLEHGFFAATDFADDKEAGKCPVINETLKLMAAEPKKRKALINALIEKDVYLTSTLAVLAAGLREYEPSPLALSLMNHRARTNAKYVMSTLEEGSEAREASEAELRLVMSLEREFYKSGGKLVVGSDPTGWGGTIPGPGNHSSLFLLQEAGFSPMEIIRIATGSAAQMLEVAHRTGAVQVGLEADLILVDGKPDLDIKALTNLELVITDGVAIDGPELAAKFEQRVGR